MDLNDVGSDQVALYLSSSQGTDPIVFEALVVSTASSIGSALGYGLGLVTAGEIRSGIGSPGGGFSGVRFGTSPYGSACGFTYSGSQWNIVGVDNDVLQFGLNASNGKAIAGGGTVVINASGVRITTSDSTSPVNSYQFINPTTINQVSAIYGTDDGTTNSIIVRAEPVTGRDSLATIEGYANSDEEGIARLGAKSGTCIVFATYFFNFLCLLKMIMELKIFFFPCLLVQ